MPDLLVRSFAPFLLALQPCFTRPSFASFWALTCAWILCSGRRSLTRIIQSAQLTEFKHYCSFHRFFSQARWNLDDLGRCVFQLLLPFCAETLVGAVDDTLARKSGRSEERRVGKECRCGRWGGQCRKNSERESVVYME